MVAIEALCRRQEAGRSLVAFPSPGWETTWVHRTPHCVAFDLTRCFDLDMLGLLDATPIAPAYCAVDTILYTDLCPQLHWQRTGTLATGAQRCDFRFEHRHLLRGRPRATREPAGGGVRPTGAGNLAP